MIAVASGSVGAALCWRPLGALVCLTLWLTPAAHAGHDDEFIPTIPAERVKALLDSGEKIIFIDLRPPSEFQKGRLPGARSIPVGELQKRSAEVPQSGRVVLYCGCPPGGVDESYAYLALRGKGYRNAIVLEEGFAGWVKKKYPTEAGR
ncbi:MAG TPA: rhodanese-like domain-containing protein [Candidatus Binatia bacterium]|jgi:rhodanese-related sulfurtransferase